MAYSKTTWKDRVVEKPLTYTMQNNADGTVTLIPAEGTIVDPGTALNAAVLNNLETQYEKAIADLKTGSQTFQGPISISNQPYLEVSKTDVPAISPNTWVKLFPNVTKENTGGGTWTSGAYTVPSAGNYLIYFSTKISSIAAGAAQFSAVYVNGALKDDNRVEQRQNTGTIDDTMVGMVMIKLAANDKLEFYVYHTDSVARNLNYSYIRLQKLT